MAKVTIIREIMLYDVELDISEEPTQEEVNQAVEKYIDKTEKDDPYRTLWDDTDQCGNPRIRVYDDYSGVEIYNSLENGTHN